MTNSYARFNDRNRPGRRWLAGLLLALLPLLTLAGTPVLRFEATVATGPGVDATAFVDGVEVVNVATGLPVVAAVPNASFELFTALSNGNFGYNPGGGSWAFSPSSGIASTGSAFGAPAAPDGLSVAFLQTTSGGAGFLSQTLPSLPAGLYQLRLRAAQRGSSTTPQGVRVLIDGVAVGTFTPGAAFAPYTSASFAVDPPVLRLEATVPAASNTDVTAFVDAVEIIDVATGLPVASAVPNASFETTGSLALGSYAYTPTGTGWTFGNSSGIATNGSAFGNPNAPDPSHVAFLQTTNTTAGYLSQTLPGLATGTYQVRLQAAQRNTSPANQGVRVLIDGVVVGTFAPTTAGFATYTSNTFAIGAPVLSSVAPAVALPGAVITLNGLSLQATTSIAFTGAAGAKVVTTGFSVNAAGTQITGVVVPAGALTGPLTVTTPRGPGQLLAGTYFTRAAPLAAGTNHTAQVRANGSLWTWGRNINGQLGTGNTTQQNSPVQAGTATSWVSVAATILTAVTAGVQTDGTLWTWGNNTQGQLGDGTINTVRLAPGQVGSATTWASVSGARGGGFMLGVHTTGTLWGWGYNFDGQLGDGTTTNRLTPGQIGTAASWVSTVAADGYAVGLQADGTLWAWGDNVYGQLGDGTTTARQVPRQVGSATSWVSVTAGESHTVALRADGTLWAWGKNSNGQLGLGNTTQQTSPVQVGTATDWLSVEAGLLYTLALKTDGSLWAWGQNNNGQLGDGTLADKTSPVQVSPATGWLRMAAGANHSLAEQSCRSLRTWGVNTYGQLGDGSTTTRPSPVQAYTPSALLTFSPASAPVGSSVTVTGTSLAGLTALTVNGASVDLNDISNATDTGFTFVVPAGATATGTTTASVGCGTASSTGFTVLPPSLSSLVLSAGSLSPAFAGGTLGYTLTTNSASTTVTPTNAQTPGGTITVNGTVVGSGSASGSIALSPGPNPITVVVNAPGGGTSTTYTVAVTRCAATPLARNLALTLGANGSAAVTTAALNNGSSSSCGTLSLSVSPTSVSCADLSPDPASNPALNFTANSQYVALPSSSPVPVGNSSYTIEAWIKPTAMGGYGIIGWGSYSANNQTNALRLTATGITNYWWNNDLTVTTGSLVGAWHHVAATYDQASNTRTIYLDGVSVGSNNPGGTHAVPNASNLAIGWTHGGEYFRGSIDEVRVWSRALTTTEIGQSAAQTNPTSLAGLVSRWDMREGSGTVVRDVLGNTAPGTLTGAATWVTPGIAYGGVMAVLTASDGLGNSASAAANLTVTAPPLATLTSLSPSPAPAGTLVTATGTNLGGATALTVNGAPATISSLTATGFTFVVPVGAAASGNVVLSLPCSQTLSQALTVPPPSGITFAPGSGAPGTLVTISGTNLGAVTGVAFNGGLASRVSLVNSTTLTAYVPTGATTGTVTVTTGPGAATSASAFTVLPGARDVRVALVPPGPLALPAGSSQTLSAAATLAGFNAGGSGFDAVVTAVLPLPDGSVLLGGEFTTYNGLDVPNALVRVLADGTIDPGFNPGGAGFFNGTTPNAVVRALALTASGQLLVAGNFNTYNGTLITSRLVRLNANGSRDASFNPSGSGFNGGVLTLAVQADGKILAGGSYSSYAGQASAPDYLVRANADGSLDTSFNAGGAGFNQSVTTLAVQADGAVLVGGLFTTYNGTTVPTGLVRLRPDGGLDASYNAGGTGFSGGSATISALALQADGNVLAGGNFTAYNGAADTPDNLIRLSPNGSRDLSFNGTNAGVSGGVLALAVQADGKVVVGGGFGSYNGSTAAPDNLLRLSATGSLDAGFANAAVNSIVVALAPEADGQLVIGGYFTAVGGSAPAYAQRLNPDGTRNATTTTLSGATFAFSPGGSTGATLSVSTAGTYTATATDPLTGYGTASNAVVVTITPPTITALSTAAELPGQAVVLTGTGFAAGSSVSFGGVAAGVTYNSPTSLTAVVPVGAAAGSSAVVVSTGSLSSSSAPAFEVLTVFRSGVPSGCLSTAPLTLDGSTSAWRYLRLPGVGGAVVAAIEDTYNLGTVTAGFQALGTNTSTPVRVDGRASRAYLDRNFFLTATNPAFPGQSVRVRFFGLSAELSRLTAVDANATAASLRASQYDGPNQNCELTDNAPSAERRLLAAPATVVPGADWFTAQATVNDHFSEFYLTGASAPLPVELLSFTAEQHGATVALAWRTASEHNSARFEVQRSRDGRRFEPIGTVAAQGSTASPTAYTFRDSHYPGETNLLYYRLRQVDTDGAASYSPVRALSIGHPASLTLYPNPAHATATVTGLSAGALVEVNDALGRAVTTATADASGTARLTLPTGLAAGVYIVRSGLHARRLTVE